MSSREERLAQNEIVFRHVNEQIAGLSQKWGGSENLDIVCECADIQCSSRIAMTTAEYEDLRENPRQFAVLPGHEVADIEDVVEERDRYLIVEKHVETHDQVEEADPRS